MIVATAGHVDHGKTLLVKKLTGMDTDRLEEEKRRGMSINLGFAYRKINDHGTVAFIDVPGHRRFINNMIAGISAIDLGMLIVAADDGPMPQTREHLDLMSMSGVTRFVLVITKIDRVDNERVRQVRASALALFPVAMDVPVFEVDSPAGLGIEELASFIEQSAGELADKPASGYFRLSIDRAFLIKGSGLVVTGTVASGSVRVGDSLLLVPQNRTVRIRSMQTQEQQADEARAGQRCALNISGDVEKDDIERGDWLVHPDAGSATMRLDARIQLLENAAFALKHMGPVKLHIGAKRIPARLALLEQKTLAAGQSALAQLIIDKPLHCCHGDRFLLRDDSENETLGGGMVLDPFAIAIRRSSPLRLKMLAAMEQDNPAQVLESILFELKQMIDIQKLCSSWNIRKDEEHSLKLPGHGKSVNVLTIAGTDYAVASDHWQAIVSRVEAELSAVANSDKTKAKSIQTTNLKRLLTAQFPGIDASLVFAQMEAEGIITLAKDSVTLCEQDSGLSEEEQALWRVIEAHLRKCGASMPVTGDLAESLGEDASRISAVLKLAAQKKWLVMLVNKRPVLAELLGQFADAVRLLVGEQEVFSVADFRKACGIGRNQAVEVLEYFDKIGFTLRKDSGRVILRKDAVK